jgi:hypothetical protein
MSEECSLENPTKTLWQLRSAHFGIFWIDDLDVALSNHDPLDMLESNVSETKVKMQ